MALEKARIAKAIRGSLEAQVTIHTDSDAVKSTLHQLSESQSANNIEFSLSDLLLVSEATIQRKHFGNEATIQDSSLPDHKDAFVEEDTVRYHGEEFTVSAVATPVSGHGKCPRCWKWACAENEELCVRCMQVEHQNETCTHSYA